MRWYDEWWWWGEKEVIRKVPNAVRYPLFPHLLHKTKIKMKNGINRLPLVRSEVKGKEFQVETRGLWGCEEVATAASKEESFYRELSLRCWESLLPLPLLRHESFCHFSPLMRYFHALLHYLRYMKWVVETIIIRDWLFVFVVCKRHACKDILETWIWVFVWDWESPSIEMMMRWLFSIDTTFD